MTSFCVSDNWWNTANCLKPNSINLTHESFSTDTIKRMFNSSLTLNRNIDSLNQMYFNKTYALQDYVFKNDGQLTAFCHTIKSLSYADVGSNFTEIETNGSSVLRPGQDVDFLNQLRNCFNVTTVTPAEEYWECVKCIKKFNFFQIFMGWNIVVGKECSC